MHHPLLVQVLHARQQLQPHDEEAAACETTHSLAVTRSFVTATATPARERAIPPPVRSSSCS